MMQKNCAGWLAMMIVFTLVITGCEGRKSEEGGKQLQSEVSSNQPELSLPVSGTAEEVLSGGGFTYVRLKAQAREYWVAVPETQVAVGEQLTVAEGQLMRDFPSKTLNRTFAELLVSTGFVGKEPQVASNPHGMMGGTAPAGEEKQPQASFDAALMAESQAPAGGAGASLDLDVPMGSSKAVVPFADLSVEKAEGANGFSVGEIFSKGKELNGKTVRVRGQVMKVSANIMGRNWIHIQDGSGDPLKNTHDLVATSSEIPSAGEVVTLEGVLRADKDFGAGYVYAVILEDAKILR